MNLNPLLRALQAVEYVTCGLFTPPSSPPSYFPPHLALIHPYLLLIHVYPSCALQNVNYWRAITETTKATT
jgi:hypothetical protein